MWSDTQHHEAQEQRFSAVKVSQAETLQARGASSLIGRKVIRYTINHGDYGDGSGPGFLGFLLEADAAGGKKREWLVVTIAAASESTLLNGRIVGPASATMDGWPKPLIYYKQGSLIDEFGPRVNDARIVGVDLRTESLSLTFETANGTSLMEIVNADDRLTPFMAKIKIEGKATPMPRKAIRPGEKLGDYVIFLAEDKNLRV